MNVVSQRVPVGLLDGDRSQGRRILVLDFDLYRFVGGGQSVYQRLIALRPSDTFYYFRRLETADAARPTNVIAIPYRTIYRSRSDHLPRGLAHFLWPYVECRNMAASAACHSPGIGFDVADAPDYNQLGLFIRPALEAEGLRVATVAVAMHGTLSSAFRTGWPTGLRDGPMLAELRVREHLQFRAADARYAISESYAAHWSRYAPLDVNLLDPLCIADRSDPLLPKRSSEPVDLAFIGRREKWKGPDLFLDIAWWIDPALYRRLLLIGPDGPNHLGTGSDTTLADMARRRGLHADVVGAWPRAEVDALFATRTLLLLPSRHDTFNLTALEAIRHGCPVLVSSRAGVADWLRANLPELDWLITDIDCSRTAASHAASILKDYDAYREKLVVALQRRRLRPDEATADTVYLPGSRQDVKARQTTVDLAARFTLLLQLDRTSEPGPLARGGGGAVRHSVGWLLPYEFKRAVRIANRSLRTGGRDALNTVRRAVGIGRLKTAIRDFTGYSPRTFIQINRSRGLPAFREWMLHGAERRDQEVLFKIGSLSKEVPDRLVDRVRLFRELARLERRAGRDIVAATYALRLMRWLGRDAYGDLPFVVAMLEAEGFAHEARTARVMFGRGPDAFDRCLDLMHDAVERNRHNPIRPLAVVDDRRNDSVPRVSVIVSLYDAAAKLGTLLTVLSQQSLAQRGELEVVLVDSNSPGDERGAFAAFAAENSLPVVYARSRERETIQAAWNRGIRLSRAPYLAFLGADEGLHPEALCRLAAALDANPGVDWAMADSLVTSVDRNGVFDSDVMPYDRRGYRQDLVYLETCYLSWVGGLYRRSIHDRFGWYDESFRAAGDTEFKNRIMPHIRSVHVPGMLGVFNNYPEERTTQHPHAEIEDLRSWYLWRTTAGMHYAFADRPVEDAARLFVDSLSYRKSFCGHLSTDFDLAAALAEHLAGRPDAPAWAATALSEARAALSLIRGIDLVPEDMPHGPRGALAALWVHRQLTAMRRLAVKHRSVFAMQQTPHYKIFNDNRYEQHWYSWSDR